MATPTPKTMSSKVTAAVVKVLLVPIQQFKSVQPSVQDILIPSVEIPTDSASAKLDCQAPQLVIPLSHSPSLREINQKKMCKD